MGFVFISVKLIRILFKGKKLCYSSPLLKINVLYQHINSKNCYVKVQNVKSDTQGFVHNIYFILICYKTIHVPVYVYIGLCQLL